MVKGKYHGSALCLTEELGQMTQTLCAWIRSAITTHTYKAERGLNETKQVKCLESCAWHMVSTP